MKSNLNPLWYRCFDLYMTRRVERVPRVVYSETQGRGACTLEMVHEIQVKFSLCRKWAEW